MRLEPPYDAGSGAVGSAGPCGGFPVTNGLPAALPCNSLPTTNLHIAFSALCPGWSRAGIVELSYPVSRGKSITDQKTRGGLTRMHAAAAQSGTRRTPFKVGCARKRRGSTKSRHRHGSAFQIWAAYSAIVRSLENFPE